jgi:nucleotide-binding universal stress UspA family protein
MLAFKTILYPIDLDAERVSSVVVALEFARLFKSRIHILYVNDPMAGYRKPTDHEDAVALRVKDEVPDDLLQDVDIIYAISKGESAEEIIKYARENKVDLIIVGHKHHSRLYSYVFDRTDIHIIDEAFVPIFIIPEKE